MNRREQRRGGALVIALLTLMVVMLLSGAVLRSLLAARRQSAKAAAALQAAWLAESALERAAIRLASDKTYMGETWQMEISDDSEEPMPAVARIEVKADNTTGKQISVRSEFRGVTVSKVLRTALTPDS